MCPTSGGRTLPVKVNVFQKPKYIIYCLYRLLYISFIVYIVPFANAVDGTHNLRPPINFIQLVMQKVSGLHYRLTSFWLF